MYVKTHCPVCGTDLYHNIRLHALEHMRFEGEEQACTYVVEQVEVTDTLTEEEIAREVLLSLKGYVRDGIEVRELVRILKKYYGIAAAYCCDLVVRLKVELDMYCPDRKHLYYVDPIRTIKSNGKATN